MNSALTLPGMCWPLHATVGNIAVTTSTMSGHFRAGAGCDGLVLCDLLPAGKFRNGAVRHWCRTHQCYWGTKADLADFAASQQMRCKQHASPMGYMLYPDVLDVSDYHAITLDYLDDGTLRLQAKANNGGTLLVRDVSALAIDSRSLPGLFHPSIVQINITPPAALAYVAALRSGVALGCIDCPRCAHPHLDLGDFALSPHRRHLCGHCGYDAVHGVAACVSTPLQRLRDHALRKPGHIKHWF
ncbi:MULTISPECIES: hypothetical protein [unclassified Janthinobacterium]|uniref:hypothetical protein n=1 Tax=unclassified Janthinobacterium TaxID=2610881 RepID=UPI00161E5B51|nr:MULTISPECIES: hypothetical protein [unclassified Janthinobacterium]MBB5609380.1 hypothetical protein [Janthinobacterium sp. S3T4]MBB5614553.1 hypothetical protein [Janthinobacterium sp. S3M3]